MQNYRENPASRMILNSGEGIRGLRLVFGLLGSFKELRLDNSDFRFRHLADSQRPTHCEFLAKAIDRAWYRAGRNAGGRVHGLSKAVAFGTSFLCFWPGALVDSSDSGCWLKDQRASE